jgi:four helix bundle protein
VSGGDFRKLVVWQKGRDLTVQIYKLTDEGRIARDFGLRDQMRRAAISICSNIAEGNDRNTDRDTAQFLYIAKGSTAELMSLLDIAAASDTWNHRKQTDLWQHTRRSLACCAD